MRKITPVLVVIVALISLSQELLAQQVLGNITGVVSDATGASIPEAQVSARSLATNLTITTQTKSNGSYLLPNLPTGTYELTFSKPGFDTEQHTNVLVEGDRTSSVLSVLKVGAQSTIVEVTGTPLMNQADTTNGYVVDQMTIQNTPLGTGSFTQLAILSPGVHADFLGSSGTNGGLGNQAIFANGQRATSNSFSLNGVSTDNLFNGNSTSQVGENRFVLNTGESFGPGGVIGTSTSVYAAIGEALPTPAPESIEEIRVNTSMYNASEGAHSGAHIGITTKSGTNEFHGELFEHFQNSFWNAAPFFFNASDAIPSNQKVPKLNRNQFGATLGGPIKKDKLFFFVAYQGIRAADDLLGISQATVPTGLTDDRSPATLANVINSDFGTSLAVSQISPVALKLLQTKLPNGTFLIPSANVSPDIAGQLGYNALVQGPSSLLTMDQGSGNIDYNVSGRDRLSGKYFYQNDPTTSPFGTQSATLGFAQQLQAGSQVGSIQNTVVLSPSLTWEQHVGFTRLRAYATADQPLTPSDAGINLFGTTRFPAISINLADPTLGNGFSFGPVSNFSNAGMFQNQWEYESNLGWVVGRHTISIGANWDHTQLNIINRNNETANLGFSNFADFLTGTIRPGTSTEYFNGNSNRYYRSDTIGAYVNDAVKLTKNLNVTLGVRWDYDGPLSEKYGLLTNFYGNLYQYDAASDTILNSGLVFAGNNKNFHTPGVSNSTMLANQWGIAPRIGLAWTPEPKLTVRTGFGMYYDRGQFFSEFSPSAGGGFNGPFGVTLQPPFVTLVLGQQGATASAPFGDIVPAPPPVNAASFQALLPNASQLSSGNLPNGNQFGPFLFGGYDPLNKLPYTENWTFDLQYQATNSLLLSLGYVGNHGVHEVLPIPFNQPQVATPSHPVNGQIYSYGYNVNALETVSSFTGGNTDIRVPYIGYSPNSVFYEAEGISWYHGLQVQARKRLSFGLQFTASYTWSHTLDEQSGQGLFYTGNDPLNPKSGYASADFDQPHTFLVNYTYQLPKLTSHGGLLGALANGWTISGQWVAQSGTPYSVYDFSGSIASIFYGPNDYITNPILPLKPGVTSGQAQLQGTTGVNAGKPVLDVNAFTIPTLAPGQMGVPPADSNGVVDTFESAYGNSGRNLFRAPFQFRIDQTIGKQFAITERVRLRFDFDAFNLTNHPSFDAPNNNVSFYNFGNPPTINNPPSGELGMIQHTIGSPRFLQADLHLTF
jgi:hypothetical protein